jgi:hypothetical protein
MGYRDQIVTSRRGGAEANARKRGISDDGGAFGKFIIHSLHVSW